MSDLIVVLTVAIVVASTGSYLVGFWVGERYGRWLERHEIKHWYLKAVHRSTR